MSFSRGRGSNPCRAQNRQGTPTSEILKVDRSEDGEISADLSEGGMQRTRSAPASTWRRDLHARIQDRRVHWNLSPTRDLSSRTWSTVRYIKHYQIQKTFIFTERKNIKEKLHVFQVSTTHCHHHISSPCVSVRCWWGCSRLGTLRIIKSCTLASPEIPVILSGPEPTVRISQIRSKTRSISKAPN